MNQEKNLFLMEFCIYGGVTMHSTADSISKNIIVPVTVDNKQQFSLQLVQIKNGYGTRARL